MVCDGLSVGVCASDSDAAGHRSLPAGRLGQEHHHHHSGADGGQGTGPQHTRGPGHAVSPMCAAGGGSKVGGLLLPGPYLSGECGADGVRHGGWQAGHPAAGGPAGEGGPLQKSRSGRSGGAPDAGGGARLRGRSPLPIQLRRVCGGRGGRSVHPSHSAASLQRGVSSHRGGGCPGGGPVAPAPGGRV